MPIRFRCVYCDKLLGIARRKAGAVVNCPHCAEKLIVPTPDPADSESHADDDVPGTEEGDALAAAAAAGKMKLFENDDVEALLEEKPTFRTSDGAPPVLTKPPPIPAFATIPQVAPPAPAPPPLPVPIRAAANGHPMYAGGPPPLQHGSFVSASRMTWLSVVGVILLALAFGIGLICGRMMK